MKKITEGLRAIWGKDKLMIAVMILNLLLGLTLFVTGLLSLSPGNLMTNVGYADMGGYREGSWYYFVGFMALGLIVAVAHNVIAIWLYEEKGRGTASTFLVAGMLVGAFALSTLIGLAGGIL